jgi:hypothetical protein
MDEQKIAHISAGTPTAYEPPKVKFMNEQEIFAALQISVNASSWWMSM